MLYVYDRRRKQYANVTLAMWICVNTHFSRVCIGNWVTLTHQQQRRGRVTTNLWLALLMVVDGNISRVSFVLMGLGPVRQAGGTRPFDHFETWNRPRVDTLRCASSFSSHMTLSFICWVSQRVSHQRSMFSGFLRSTNYLILFTKPWQFLIAEVTKYFIYCHHVVHMLAKL